MSNKVITFDGGIPLTSAQCMVCRHYLGDADGPTPNCAAFKQIPVEIWKSEFDHREPYEGDGGIRFEDFRENAA